MKKPKFNKFKLFTYFHTREFKVLLTAILTFIVLISLYFTPVSQWYVNVALVLTYIGALFSMWTPKPKCPTYTIDTEKKRIIISQSPSKDDIINTSSKKDDITK